MRKSLTSWGRLALVALFGISSIVNAAPAFRAASSAGKGLSPEFRSAASASAPGIAFRAAASAATNTTSLAVNLPSGTSANDVMIASISVRPYTATITAPSGWTLVRRVNFTTLQTSSLAIYRKVASSSEASSFTWSFSGSTYAAGGIQSFTGVDTTNPVDIENGQGTSESLSHATPSVTTTVANAMLVTAHSFPSSTSWTPPSGMTEGFDVQYGASGGPGQSIEANYGLQTVAGATGAKTATAAGDSNYIDPGTTHILALRPAAPVLAVNKPAGTTTNDVLIASVSVRPSSATITAPSGWTLVRRVDNTTGQTSSLVVYSRVAGSSEPSSYTWATSGATFALGGIQSFYNVDTTSSIDVENGHATADSLTHATPSITTTVANTMLVASHSLPTSTTWSAPSGMTEAFDVLAPVPGTDGTGHSLETSWVVQGAAGASGAKSATAAGSTGHSDPGVTHLLALKPSTSGASLAINTPAGTQANDVMIASVAVRPSSATIGTPSGWTLVRRIDNTSGQSTSLAVFRKVAASGEAASHTWDVSGGVYAVGGVQSFSGIDTANPIDVENGQATANGLTHATPSVTTTVADTMLVTSHTFATSTSWTPPTGMTEGFDAQVQPVQTAFGQSMEGNYVLQAVAGATGTKTATSSGSGADSDIGAAHILALRSAPVVATPQLYYIHADHLNTPRLIANSDQQTVWKWDNTEPFGVNAPDENPSALGSFVFPLRFPGQYADKETNFHYNYHRDYDPSSGRYAESDPIGLRGGLNTYAYVASAPLSLDDYYGLQAYPSCRGETTCINAMRAAGILPAKPELPRDPPPGATCMEKCDHFRDVCYATAGGSGFGLGQVVRSVVTAFIPGARMTATVAGAVSGGVAGQNLSLECQKAFNVCKAACNVCL